MNLRNKSIILKSLEKVVLSTLYMILSHIIERVSFVSARTIILTLKLLIYFAENPRLCSVPKSLPFLKSFNTFPFP